MYRSLSMESCLLLALPRHATQSRLKWSPNLNELRVQQCIMHEPMAWRAITSESHITWRNVIFSISCCPNDKNHEHERNKYSKNARHNQTGRTPCLPSQVPNPQPLLLHYIKITLDLALGISNYCLILRQRFREMYSIVFELGGHLS